MTKILIDVADTFPQELRIRVMGPNVPFIEGNSEPELDTLVPDPIATIASAASLGLLDGARAAEAAVVERRFDDTRASSCGVCGLMQSLESFAF